MAENLIIQLGHHLAGLDFLSRFHRDGLYPAGDLKRQIRFGRLDVPRQLYLIFRFFLARPSDPQAAGLINPNSNVAIRMRFTVRRSRLLGPEITIRQLSFASR